MLRVKVYDENAEYSKDYKDFYPYEEIRRIDTVIQSNNILYAVAKNGAKYEFDISNRMVEIKTEDLPEITW